MKFDFTSDTQAKRERGALGSSCLTDPPGPPLLPIHHRTPGRQSQARKDGWEEWWPDGRNGKDEMADWEAPLGRKGRPKPCLPWPVKS